LPSGLVTDTVYYIIAAGLTSTQFELSLTSGGSALSLAATSAEAFIVSVGSPCRITLTNNYPWVVDGIAVTLTTTGALPTGLAISTTYYVVNTTNNPNDEYFSFSLSDTSGGTAINTSGSESGTHTVVLGASSGYGTHTLESIGYGFPEGCTTVSYMNGRFIACEPDTQNFLCI